MVCAASIPEHGTCCPSAACVQLYGGKGIDCKTIGKLASRVVTLCVARRTAVCQWNIIASNEPVPYCYRLSCLLLLCTEGYVVQCTHLARLNSTCHLHSMVYQLEMRRQRGIHVILDLACPVLVTQ